MVQRSAQSKVKADRDRMTSDSLAIGQSLSFLRSSSFIARSGRFLFHVNGGS